MSEKMLVTQALDERDLLVKKIGDKIRKMKVVDVKKRNEERTAGERVPVEEFSNTAAASYQQILDLIDRYQRVDAAIVASNAAHTIHGRHFYKDLRERCIMCFQISMGTGRRLSVSFP